MRNYTWTIRWSNPYTKPPDGKPEVLLSVTRSVASTADVPQEIQDFKTIGTGYAIHCCCEDTLQPKRKLKVESLHKLRRTKLRKRLEKKSPLYAKELFTEELRAKPEYYGRAEPQKT